MFDILFRNAKVIDGTGNPWFYGDVGVEGGTVAAVLPPGSTARARRVEDVDGKALCPGFVDGHSHSELPLLAGEIMDCKIMQGVTTENLGLDGMSLAPIKDGDKADWKKHLSGLAGTLDVPWTWNSFAEYLDCLQAAKPPLNVSSYVGLGTVRLSVMGMTDRPAEDHEIRAMRDLVARCMDEGARGISAGLIYPPSRYQNLEETVAVAKAAAAHGGIYDVHMRNEADAIAESVEEVIAISERSGIPAMITHFKIRGKKNWGRSAALIRRIDEARAAGIDVTMAQYPYTAGSTFLHVVIPPWYHSRGVDGLLRALREERGAIKHDLDTRMDWDNFSQAVGWEISVVSSVVSEANQPCVGKSISQIAAERGHADAADAAFDLLVEEQLAVGMISFGLDEADITAIMRHPAVSFITDGLMSGRPHPRAYATYPRILGRYVREQGVLSLEEAVRKMTSLPARKIRLRNKGVIAEGYDADLVVFDPDTVIDKNSYDDPRVDQACARQRRVRGGGRRAHGRTAREGHQGLGRTHRTKSGCPYGTRAAITGCGNNTRIPAPKRTAGERFQVPERIAFLMTGRHTFTPEDGAFPAAAYPFPEIPMLTSSQKVFDVLEFLCANGPHKALEVSKALSLQKSSVHRFLNSLIEFGYVRKDDQTGLFSVTLKVVQLGAMVSSKIDMVETGRSYMRELVATFDQATVSFATFMDKQVLVLRREYPRNCVTRIDLSQQLPAYCTGLGKALLSTKSEEEIDEYLDTFRRYAYSLNTLLVWERQKHLLLAAKEKGYAEDISEISDSLHCVAVPILTPHGGLWAISLSGHCSVIREYGVENIVKHLKKAVWDMTSGYSAAPVA